jgi:hypothetical protein
MDKPAIADKIIPINNDKMTIRAKKFHEEYGQLGSMFR